MKIKMIISFILISVVSAMLAVSVSASPSASRLPAVGGIGTTVFYVGGGILIVLAIVLILTKARMGKDK